MIKLKFWGVRGSIPCPGVDTVKYGGNTACLELRFVRGTEEKTIIVDAGSGIRALGNHLIAQDLPNGSLHLDLLITHTHWDHIMGFPFFAPIYIPGTRLNIYGPVTYESEGLDKIVGSQLSYRYFPIKQSELAAEIQYFPLKECTMELDRGVKVSSKYLNHPILCLGYRFEFEGRTIVTAYDTEPFRNLFTTDPADPSYDESAAVEGDLVAREENEKLRRFIEGADVLIHDSQYTNAEYHRSYLGWGHSSFEHVINTAHLAGVKRLYHFHHDPLRTDAQLDALITGYRNTIKGRSALEIYLAREGEEITI